MPASKHDKEHYRKQHAPWSKPHCQHLQKAIKPNFSHWWVEREKLGLKKLINKNDTLKADPQSAQSAVCMHGLRFNMTDREREVVKMGKETCATGRVGGCVAGNSDWSIKRPMFFHDNIIKFIT